MQARRDREGAQARVIKNSLSRDAEHAEAAQVMGEEKRGGAQNRKCPKGTHQLSEKQQKQVRTKTTFFSVSRAGGGERNSTKKQHIAKVLTHVIDSLEEMVQSCRQKDREGAAGEVQSDGAQNRKSPFGTRQPCELRKGQVCITGCESGDVGQRRKRKTSRQCIKLCRIASEDGALACQRGRKGLLPGGAAQRHRLRAEEAEADQSEQGQAQIRDH